METHSPQCPDTLGSSNIVVAIMGHQYVLVKTISQATSLVE